jgi:tRNA (adenine-N(1)-)-methyltransferase non-catalytic subunit
MSFIEKKTRVEYHQWCLVRLPSEGIKLIEVRPQGIVKLGKFGTFAVDQIVGFPFGQSFEILDDNNVRPISGSLVDSVEDEDRENSEEVGSTLKEKIDYLKQMDIQSSETNRNLVDIGNATQELTQEEIETLKKTANGATVGEAIIDKLIKSHVNFAQKTKHSQEKYLRRKQQKFLRRFTVDRLGASELLEHFIEKEPTRVLDMSEESLGLLLALGNIQPGGRYLVIDETGGVVVNSLLERMRGIGEMLVVHENEHPNHSALKYSNYPEDVLKRMVKTINVLQFFDPEEERVEWVNLPEDELREMKSSKKQHYYRRKENAQVINEAIDNSLRGEFDALIIASTLYTPTLVKKMAPSLAGSRPVVVYSQYKEPLVETQVESMQNFQLLAPTLHETRCRPYQTIQGRLHPLMTMKGGGGYLFSAIKVHPIENGVQAVGRGMKKRKIEDTKESMND